MPLDEIYITTGAREQIVNLSADVLILAGAQIELILPLLYKLSLVALSRHNYREKGISVKGDWQGKVCH